MFDPQKHHPMIFETVIISCTVLIMCPLMSFLAAWMYYPYYSTFHILTLLANWLKLVCFHFPFAFFSQIFFIQPFVRWAFKKIFAKDIAAHHTQAGPDGPQNEWQTADMQWEGTGKRGILTDSMSLKEIKSSAWQKQPYISGMGYMAVLYFKKGYPSCRSLVGRFPAIRDLKLPDGQKKRISQKHTPPPFFHAPFLFYRVFDN